MTFIVRQIADRHGMQMVEVARDANMFEQGYMDSLGVFTMLMQIEDEFAVRLGEDDLVDPRIGSVTGLAAVVADKKLRLT